MSKLCIQMSVLFNADVINRLAKRRIFTVLDFLQEDAEKLACMTKISYKDIINLRNSLISNYSAFPCNGIDTYNDLVANSAIISTGIPSLDGIIDGGFLTGHLYEICGLSGTGKTQLCLTVAANIADNLEQGVHYIDTKMDFSGRRIQAMLDARGCNDRKIGLIMERIQITQAHNVHQVLAFLHHLKISMSHEQDVKIGTRLIIIDSLPAIFYSFLGGSSKDSLGLLNQMVNVMKYLATEYHIAFLLVNLITKSFEEERALQSESCDKSCIAECENLAIIKPALGKYWAHVPSTRLCINGWNSNLQRQIRVIKTNNSVGGSCAVTVNNKGLV